MAVEGVDFFEQQAQKFAQFAHTSAQRVEYELHLLEEKRQELEKQLDRMIDSYEVLTNSKYDHINPLTYTPDEPGTVLGTKWFVSPLTSKDTINAIQEAYSG